MNQELIEEYCRNKSTHPSEACEWIFEQTCKNEDLPQMLTGPLEASFLGMLAKLNNVKSVLEIGTFTGYSAVNFADNLPTNGTVTTIDLDKKQIAIEGIKRSPCSSKIKMLTGDALNIMDKLDEKFDLIFIDADKKSYGKYFEKSLEMLNDKNSFIVIDNCLWSGKVINKDLAKDSDEFFINCLNERIKNDSQLQGTLVPIRDGVFIVRKI